MILYIPTNVKEVQFGSLRFGSESVQCTLAWWGRMLSIGRFSI